MSPAGIPMFYGALDAVTAFLETFDPNRRGGNKSVTLGTFVLERQMLLLDLTNLPAFPSPFDRERRDLRRPLGFLYEFVDDLTKPIARDGREHVEYVPTQVVTEFIRHRHRTASGDSLDGILYSSSREGAVTAVVFFLDALRCGPREKAWAGDPDPALTLVATQTVDPLHFLGRSATR